MSENERLERLRSDGQKQLAVIYEMYRKEFLHWVTKEFGCSMDDSKDIYQLTILAFYENVRSGKLHNLVSSVKTYLFAVGKNVARAHFRKINRRARHEQQWSMECVDMQGSDAPEDYVFEAAGRALSKLDASRRNLIELVYYERRSMEEISTLLRYRNANTAKNQKCKAMARLRKLFAEELTFIRSRAE